MKVHDRLTAIDGKLCVISETLIRQEESLRLHMYRTELAEKRIEKVESDIEPIKDHVKRMDGAAKLVALLALIVGVTSGIIKLLWN